MRSTGGEGFLPIRCLGNEQNSSDYEGVRNDDDRERDQQSKQGRDEIHRLSKSPLGAREVEQRADVTEEVVDEPGAAEGELGNEGDFEHSYEEAEQPGARGQLQAGPAAHGERVVQRGADGHVAVVGHGGQQDTLGAHQGNEKVQLGHAAAEGDVLVLHHQDDQQLGDGD